MELDWLNSKGQILIGVGGVQSNGQKTWYSVGVADQPCDRPSGQAAQGGEQPRRKQTVQECVPVPTTVLSNLCVLTTFLFTANLRDR